jgi:hypothetical protein
MRGLNWPMISSALSPAESLESSDQRMSSAKRRKRGGQPEGISKMEPRGTIGRMVKLDALV